MDPQQHEPKRQVATNAEATTESSFSEAPIPNHGQPSSEEFRQFFLLILLVVKSVEVYIEPFKMIYVQSYIITQAR